MPDPNLADRTAYDQHDTATHEPTVRLEESGSGPPNPIRRLAHSKLGKRMRFLVGLTSESIQPAGSWPRIQSAYRWPRPAAVGEAGPWTPQVGGRLSWNQGVGYCVYDVAHLIDILEYEELWEVDVQLEGLVQDGPGWMARAARLRRQILPFDDHAKRRISSPAVADALRQLAADGVADPGLDAAQRIAGEGLVGAAIRDATVAAQDAAEQVQARWHGADQAPAAMAATYAALRAAVCAGDPLQLPDALFWAARAGAFAAVTAVPVGWLERADAPFMSEPARERFFDARRRYSLLAAGELGIDVDLDPPQAPDVQLPTRPRLSQNGVPRWADFAAAARRYAILSRAERRRELCGLLFDWLTAADPGRAGVALSEIVTGVSAAGLRVEGASSEAVIFDALNQAVGELGLFEELPDGRWRVVEDFPEAWVTENAGYLLKAAAVEGWDIVIPGTGYEDNSESAEEIVILAGPSGTLEYPVRIARHPDEEIDEDKVDVAFLFLPDPGSVLTEESDWEAQACREITFDCDPTDEPSFSTFSTEVVIPDGFWGFPDFREPTHGWASWLGSELVIAWTRPGDELQECRKQSFSPPEYGVFYTGFWVALARCIASFE